MSKEVKYSIRKSKRAKRMRLAVYCDGSVVVTSPHGIRQSIIERFVSDKKQWILKKLEFFEKTDGTKIRTLSRKDYLENKDRARTLVLERLQVYKKIYDFPYNKVCIKNQKTRWGSCSGKRNLNINYKIIFLPAKLQDYIIVHELCHLQEFNHSRKFWNLVKKAIPDYLDIKKQLRNHELFYK